MGIMMALTRVKPVVSHWAVEVSLTFISAMMAGSAGVTRVWLSTVTKVPKISTAIINFCLLVSPMVRFLSPEKGRPKTQAGAGCWLMR